MPGPEGSCGGSDFCQELAGVTDTAFRRVYAGDPERRIISQGATLSLLADMSPLVRGHLLLVSNRHYFSFGEVAIDHREAVTASIEKISPQYLATFGELVIMEHGSTDSMDGSACITHAHLHLLPLRLSNVHETMVRDDLASRHIDGIADLAQLGRAGLPYFYCGDTTTHRVYGVAQTRPRQYLRSVAGRLLGLEDPEWDYALIVRKDLLKATVRDTVDWRIPVP